MASIYNKLGVDSRAAAVAAAARAGWSFDRPDSASAKPAKNGQKTPGRL